MLGFLKSNILSKFVVAITGLIMVGFIVGHTLGNLLIYAGPEAINTYAVGLKDIGGVVWAMRIVLIISLILHVITTINLVRQNKKIAPGYKVNNHKAATFSSKFMAYAGLTVMFFILYHLAHFTFGVVDTSAYSMEATLDNGRVVHDVYSMVVLGFRNIIVSLFYIIAVVFLGLHLKHGIHSMFQSLGIHGKKFTPMIQKVAVAFSVINLVKQPQVLKRTLMGLGILAVFLVVSYAMASDAAVLDPFGKVLEDGEAGSISKWVSTGINFSFILGAIGIIFFVVDFAKGLIK